MSQEKSSPKDQEPTEAEVLTRNGFRSTDKIYRISSAMHEGSLPHDILEYREQGFETRLETVVQGTDYVEGAVRLWIKRNGENEA